MALALILPAVAFVGLRGAPMDVYPEFMPPTVEIQTEALGLSAAEVEHLITLGMEQDLLNGVPWLKSIHSTSMPGLSVVDLLFEPGTDLYAARQMVTERMTQARVLPNVGSAPVMIEPLASTSRVAMIGLSSKTLSLVDLSLLARWKLRPRLMGVNGVANVAVYGQRDRQLQVAVDPATLHSKKVTLTQVIETAGNALWVSPLTFVEASTPGTGGFVEGTNQRLAIQHVSPISAPAQLAAVPVQDNPAMRLGDVATVIEDHQPLIGDALVDGKPSLFLVIQKYPGADTLTVTREIDKAMAEMAPGLRGVTVTSDVYRPADYLQAALHTAGWVALAGFLLLVGFFLLVLPSWRMAVVGAVSIPAALLTAVYVLYLSGVTLTTMTLLGLSVAVGLVIDDAVRDTDGVCRRIRALDRDADARERGAAALAAAVRPRGTATFATLAVLLVTIPLLVMDAVTTAFTVPAVATFALAVAASMLVALTLTPALAVLILRGGGGTGERALVRRLHRAVGPSTGRRRPRRAALSSAGLALLLVGGLAAVSPWGPGGGSLPGTHGTALPALQDRDLLLQVRAAPGTSLTEMDRITGRAAQELRWLSGVVDVGVHVGRAVSSDQQVDTDAAELWITVAPAADYDATRAAVTSVMRGYPGLQARLLTYADGRLAAAQTGDDLVVRVYGIDLDTLHTTAVKTLAAISGVPGLVAPALRPVARQPTVQIDVDVAKAQAYGLKPGDVRRDATTLTSGLIVGNLYEQAKIFDVVVWGGTETRDNLTDLQNLLIDTPAGGQVRLADVAGVSIKPQPTEITHDEVLRDVEIVAGVHGRDPDAVVADVKARLAAVPMPYEYHAEVLGDATTRQSRTREVWGVAAAAVLGLLLLLQAAAGSWRRSVLLVLLLPLSVVGGVLTAPLAGGVGSAGALAGLFAVLAVAIRGGVFLLRAVSAGGDREAVVRAARAQVLPTLMTVVSLALLLAPAAVLGSRAGLEFLHPLAVTVLGGLFSLVILLLVVLPGLLVRLTPRSRVPSPPRVLDLRPEPIPA